MKRKNPTLRAFIITLICLSCMVIGASAASNSETVQATVNHNIIVHYNGVVQCNTLGRGETVYPIVYQGTTYLPVRIVSDILGLNAEWVQSTQTVKIESANYNFYLRSPAIVSNKVENVEVLVNKDVTITYKGEPQNFYDVNGALVYPITFNERNRTPAWVQPPQKSGAPLF